MWLLTTCLANADTTSPFVVDLLIILATAALVAIVMQRIRMAVIPAYLIAGILVGPHSVGFIRSAESLETISRLAIVLLMFGIGLHLHLSVLGKNVARMVTIGATSCALSIVLGWPVAMLFGLSAPAALALCMALSLSSTAVVLRLITDRGELRHATGQLALSILVIQDLAVLGMLAILPALAQWAGAADASLVGDAEPLPRWGGFWVDAAIRIGGVTLLILIGKLAMPRLLNEASREKTGEVMMIVSVALAIGAGVAAKALGFSMELGAFLAGFLLSATMFRHQLSGQIAPLRDLFMAVFFTTLGMQLDPQRLAESWWIVLVGGAIMSLLKAVAISGTCWAFGATAATAIAVGMALAQGGEFSLVLIGAAGETGILSETVVANAIAMVVISLILTPAMVDIGTRVSHRWGSGRSAPWIKAALGVKHQRLETAGQPVGNIILGGYGQVGKAIGRALQEAGVSYIVVEIDPDAARGANHEGCSFVFGDVSNAAVLDSAGIERANALILTMPDEHAVLNACAIARRRNKDIFIVARMELARHQKKASDLGADQVIVEELETARAMQEAVLPRLTRNAG